MFDPDKVIKSLDNRFTKILSSRNETDREVQQHLGKIINHQNIYTGKLYDDFLGNIDKILKGQHEERWIGQNKKTELEKVIEVYKKEHGLNE